VKKEQRVAVAEVEITSLLASPLPPSPVFDLAIGTAKHRPPRRLERPPTIRARCREWTLAPGCIDRLAIRRTPLSRPRDRTPPAPRVQPAPRLRVRRERGRRFLFLATRAGWVPHPYSPRQPQ